MRLIDADKVKQYALTEGFYCDTDADKEATAEMIDQLFPTVEAIPIEWIKNYLKTSPKMWQGYHDEELVQEMIEDWEKEND